MLNDMTNGSPMKLILTFTIPMLLGSIFQQLYNMVDSIGLEGKSGHPPADVCCAESKDGGLVPNGLS